MVLRVRLLEVGGSTRGALGKAFFPLTFGRALGRAFFPFTVKGALVKAFFPLTFFCGIGAGAKRSTSESDDRTSFSSPPYLGKRPKED